jgi:hypothetical protein
MNLRIREQMWGPFVRNLSARREVESAGIIFGERLDGGRVLLAQRAFEVSASIRRPCRSNR